MLALNRHFIDNVRDHIRIRYVQSYAIHWKIYDKFKALKAREINKKIKQKHLPTLWDLNLNKERRNLRAERFYT